MSSEWVVLAALSAGYLAGSVPFAYLIVRARTGRDVRTVGSGNVGATNAARVLGRRWFLVIFTLDALKGALPVWATLALAPTDGTTAAWAAAAAATGAVAGHTASLFLGFRGGKAVATGAGTLAVLAPVSLAAGVVGFALLAAITRWISAGSIAAACAVALARLVPPLAPADGAFSPAELPATLFLLLLATVVILRHGPNLRRMMAGTEPRIGAGSPTHASEKEIPPGP
jgi:glycerol-3-phosphate acyltransferase PlsY